MAQDLRKLFEEEREEQLSGSGLSHGHEKRFEGKLDEEFSVQSGSRFFMFKIAAAVIVGGLITFLFFQFNEVGQSGTTPEIVDESSNVEAKPNTTLVSLGDISPELKKVEQYYTTSINYELSELSVSEENKALFDGYLHRLADLDKEYEALLLELNNEGPSEHTVTALIDNLQLKLKMLQQLRTRLNDLKQSKNEQVDYHDI